MVKFNKLYENFKTEIESIDGFQLNTHNLLKILKIGIEIVEFLNLKGSEKKRLVIDLVKKYVEEVEIDNLEKNMCLELVNNGTVEGTIELVISASNGELNINNVIDLGSSCCAILLKRLLMSRKRKKGRKRVVAKIN
jgi:hypothetical protein